MRTPICLPLYILVVFLGGLSLTACGKQAFTKGAYNDPNEVRLLDDKFGASDMQILSNRLSSRMAEYGKVKNANSAPLVMVARVNNRTDEHIDVKMLTDRLRTAVIQTGRFAFVDKDARQDIREELEYQESEYVDQATAIKKGGQLGVQYIITGDLGSNVQQVGKDKAIFYRLNMNLINVKTGVIEWADGEELSKTFKKRSVGL